MSFTRNGSNGNDTDSASVVFGNSLAHRQYTKQQRACVAVALAEGSLALRPSARQAAQLLDVSASYVSRARKLTAEQRAAILIDRSAEAVRSVPCLPAPTNGAISDGQLETLARQVGVDRMLAAAVAVEQHHAA